MQVVLSRQKGVEWFQAFLAYTAETGKESATAGVITCSLFVNNMLCYIRTVLRRFMSYTLISPTNAQVVRGRSTLNDVDRFGMGRRFTNLQLES